MTTQKDNSTLPHKLKLRRLMLERCEDPIILETHGGEGKVFAAVYSGVQRGAVFEKNPEKADILVKQRPTWSVFEAPCEKAIAEGIADHLPFNVVDVDPYGSPFPVIEAFFSSPRKFPDVLHLVVNDGLRQKVQLGGAWSVGCLRDIVEDFGNDLHKEYLQVAKEKVRRLAAVAGYKLAGWLGYHCGFGNQMSHYWAQLRRA